MPIRKTPPTPTLLTDLYQLTMLQAYQQAAMNETAVFEFFVRKLPATRGFLVAAGLEQCLEFIEDLHFDAASLDYLRDACGFPADFTQWLAEFRFTGDVDAMPEGTVFFPDEPILRVTAPLPQAQFLETRLVNLLHFQTLVASKAARMVLAARGRTLVDFGLRRAHGAEAGLLAARAAYIAGFTGTATLMAGAAFGIPTYGTMAHSFILAHDSETAALAHFARARPKNLILLIDTYDTVAAAWKVVELGSRLKPEGIDIRGVRIDSGDFMQLAPEVRRILDKGGLREAIIFASGGLDENDVARLVAGGAPIDGFGIGTSLTTSSDAPGLDCAYKLQEYAGVPRRKLSPGKANWPGPKQVWRRFDDAGRMCGDVVSCAGDDQQGIALLEPVMRNGRRVQQQPGLADMRQTCRASLEHLPLSLAGLQDDRYPVQIATRLRELAEACDRRIAEMQGRAGEGGKTA